MCEFAIESFDSDLKKRYKSPIIDKYGSITNFQGEAFVASTQTRSSEPGVIWVEFVVAESTADRWNEKLNRELIQRGIYVTNAPQIEVKECECVNWAQDGRDMNAAHHYNCPHYVPTPIDPKYAKFGLAMWRSIEEWGGDFCNEEVSEVILPMAAEAGLCSRVEYDPELHGKNLEAEPGDEIWWWGEAHHSHQHAKDCIDEICGALGIAEEGAGDE
mgnify:CR=1 FL=1